MWDTLLSARKACIKTNQLFLGPDPALQDDENEPAEPTSNNSLVTGLQNCWSKLNQSFIPGFVNQIRRILPNQNTTETEGQVTGTPSSGTSYAQLSEGDNSTEHPGIPGSAVPGAEAIAPRSAHDRKPQEGNDLLEKSGPDDIDALLAALKGRREVVEWFLFSFLADLWSQRSLAMVFNASHLIELIKTFPDLVKPFMCMKQDTITELCLEMAPSAVLEG
eukprot:c57134_g1_i1.p1 GENE.c57134_g1_i1~~c57134_g1_i1.p1  ORF type:complete len:238 (-),score=39.26 c57134_g1_i1:91-750(-)